MSHHKKGDYEYADEYLSQHEKEIQFDNKGKKYEELTKAKQKEVLLDLFFSGLSQYEKAAKDMRDGLGYAAAKREPEKLILRGHEHMIQRGENGRIEKWLS